MVTFICLALLLILWVTVGFSPSFIVAGAIIGIVIGLILGSTKTKGQHQAIWFYSL